ncbi:phosphatase PAP2 family protein [Dechloromonas sp.]|uniref:phosphatase PAP2 family protein n=1 Tax=Dechloromonas sp. TaxID=1917218 RepID=UPI001228CF2D|nr:phosphatase PAP2 family protein [Dechloromonas sp.]MBU3697035.1 phosphatase PAP2 family protein [Dechloromonas sp.]TEX49463.1 MAG: hypothetical protein CFR70_03175 [Rhodocyclaceae bacterium]
MIGAGDAALLGWLAANRQPWLDALMLGVTWLGSLWLLLPAAGLFTLLWRQSGLRTLGALMTASVLCHLLKVLIDRPRPDLWPSLFPLPVDAAFPSAHSAQAMAVAVALCYLLPASRRMRVGGGLILLAGLVGLSRLYLQVHWPSDVVFGWLLGAGVAIVSLRLAKAWRLDRARQSSS